MLRVVSGPLPPRARRAGSPLMPPLWARRRSAPDWPFMSRCKLRRKNGLKWGDMAPSRKHHKLKQTRRRARPPRRSRARTRNRTFDPGRDQGGGPRPADDSEAVHGTPRPRRRRPGDALERLLADPGRRRRQLREVQSRASATSCARSWRGPTPPCPCARPAPSPRAARRLLRRARRRPRPCAPCGGRASSRLLGRGVRHDGRQRRPALWARRWRRGQAPCTGAASMGLSTWWNDVPGPKFRHRIGTARRHDLGDEPRRLGRQVLSHRRRRRATRAGRPVGRASTSPPGAKSDPMPTAFVGLNCWGVAPRDAGRGRRRAPRESPPASAPGAGATAPAAWSRWATRASMSTGSSPTVGAAASRRRCAWRLACADIRAATASDLRAIGFRLPVWRPSPFVLHSPVNIAPILEEKATTSRITQERTRTSLCLQCRFSALVTRASPLGAGIYLAARPRRRPSRGCACGPSAGWG